MAIIQCESFSFTYNDGKEKSLDSIDLEVNAGEIILIQGETGSGKSTLLKSFKKELLPFGSKEGTIIIDDCPVEGMSLNQSAEKVGFVFQDPLNQVVCDTVEAELAFGMENIGKSKTEISERIAELSIYFGMSHWMTRELSSLSTGELQLVNLASIIAMAPDILLLDEPLAQLDPVSKERFLNILFKLNDDFNLTILIVEHELDLLYAHCDQVIVLKEGQIIEQGTPRKVAEDCWQSEKINYLPIPAHIFHLLEGKGVVPINIKEGIRFISKVEGLDKMSHIDKTKEVKGETLKIRNLTFRYDRQSTYILEEVDLTLKEGDILCLFGANGSGKTTLLKVIIGVLKNKQGKIWWNQVRMTSKTLETYLGETIGYLPQNPSGLLFSGTVAENLVEVMTYHKVDLIEQRMRMKELLSELDLKYLEHRKIDTLSYGEKQLVALSKVFILRPQLVLLDEPTKGLDRKKKETVERFLRKKGSEGITMIITSHDPDFASEVGSLCTLLFRQKLTPLQTPTHFFSKHHFFTTTVKKVVHQRLKDVVTMSDLKRYCIGEGDAHEGKND